MTLTVEGTVPLLARQSPAILPALIDESFTGTVPQYGDSSWSLSPLAHGPGTSKPTIHWDTVPAVFREEVRYLSWLLINTSLPASFLIGKHPRWRTTVSPRLVYPTVTKWRALCHWLQAKGKSSLRDCTETDLRAYALYLAGERALSRGQVQKEFAALTRLWALDSSAPLPLGICEPPWLSEGADDFLPTGSSAGENSTEPITPETMGPLLIWAMRVVDDFADDILAAVQRKKDIIAGSKQNPATPEGQAALETYLGRLITDGSPLPSMVAGNKSGLAATFIAHVTGAAIRQVHYQVISGPWRERLMSADGPAPIWTELSGTVDGRPWTDVIDYSQAETLKTHLLTAAYIVVAYLTGMRPREIQGLRRGCCPEPESDRHLIYGHVYKSAVNDEGNHVPQGIPRDVPWVAIEPVVRAIRTAERINPDGYLFGNLPPTTMKGRIQKFMVWASKLARSLERPHEIVPEDKYGPVGVSRFRRTLAWHIARQPGGMVALAVQYGHMRTAMSAGYASRSRNGMHDLLDLETALATADTLTALNEDLGKRAGHFRPGSAQGHHGRAECAKIRRCHSDRQTGP